MGKTLTTSQISVTITDAENHDSVKHDAFIQTDIYGVNTLALSSKTMTDLKAPVVIEPTCTGNGNTQGNCRGLVESKGKAFTTKSPPKRQTSVKRRISQTGFGSPVSPRRKKLKSTTGMQTAVSLTKKKGVHTVNSTQTTGDFILQTAMKQANIQIHKKTVASQVTPQKANMGKEFELKSSEIQTFISGFKPHLVDSGSQVCGNIAESETMTDMPLSTSTQTLQSFLETQQDKSALRPENEQVLTQGSNFMNNYPNPSSDTKNVVNIYSETLDSSVSFRLPHSVSIPEKQQTETVSRSASGKENDGREILTAVKLIDTGTDSSTPGIQQVTDRHFTTDDDQLFEDTYLSNPTSTTDMEAQAMSASEFDQLLQSSGIFLSNDNFLQGPVTQFSPTNSGLHPTNGVNLVTQATSPSLDFLSVGTSTMDMNTQTGTEINLFDNYMSTDSNTQTPGDVDFLDLMSNMETQTLNDEDLISLGLLDNTLKTNNVHNMSVGTSDMDFDKSEFLHVPATKHGHTNVEATSYQSIQLQNIPTCYTKKALPQTGSNNQASLAPGFEKGNQSTWNYLSDTDHKQTAQMETQTSEFAVSLLQTENQTQVDLADTGFMAVNMETQTTFDELEEFCELLK